MIWNYRVFKEDDGGLSIREVFYEQDGTVLACSEPVQAEADSIAALTTQLDAFQEALDLPILSLADVPAKTPASGRSHSQTTLSHEAVLAKLGLVTQSG
jgi:hypothetical protein